MRQPREDKVDAELINGKPHFGVWFGSYILLDGDAFVGDPEKNPIYQLAYGKCQAIPDRLLKGEEIRYKQIIIKPPHASSPLILYGTMGVKYVIWGRAFRVMARLAKGVKRYKKMYRNGRRKWVRIGK